MSSGEGPLQNRTATEDEPIETCHKLLKSGDFLGVRCIVDVNQSEIRKRHNLFEQARAICDVLIAAENRLPNGLMDCYGMIRVNRFGPVLSEDFEKLMKLLDKTQNHFPYCQEAADKACLAWSLLSEPLIKAHYDFVISADYKNHETQGNGRGVEEGNNGKRKMMDSHDSEYWKGFPDSFIPKEVHNLGAGADAEDNDDYYDDDDFPEVRTSKLCIIDGKRWKLIPPKKKKKTN